MSSLFNSNVRETLRIAQTVAASKGAEAVDATDISLAAVRWLVEHRLFKAELDQLAPDSDSGKRALKHELPYTAGAKKCLENAVQIADSRGDPEAGVLHLAKGVFAAGTHAWWTPIKSQSAAAYTLTNVGLTPDRIDAMLNSSINA